MTKNAENLTEKSVDVSERTATELKTLGSNGINFPQAQNHKEEPQKGREEPHEESKEIPLIDESQFEQLKKEQFQMQLTPQQYEQMFKYARENKRFLHEGIKIQTFTPEIVQILHTYSDQISTCKIDYEQEDLKYTKEFPNIQFETKVPFPIKNLNDVKRLAGLGNLENLYVEIQIDNNIDETTANAIVENKNLFIRNKQDTNIPLNIAKIFMNSGKELRGLQCPELKQQHEKRIRNIMEEQINNKIAKNRTVNRETERGDTDNIKIERNGYSIIINTFGSEKTEYRWGSGGAIETTFQGNEYDFLGRGNKYPFSRGNKDVRHCDHDFEGIKETMENQNKLKAIFEISNTINRFKKNFVQNPEYNGKRLVFRDGKIQAENYSILSYSLKDLGKAVAEATGVHESKGLFSKDAINNLQQICDNAGLTFNPDEFCKLVNIMKAHFEK